MKHDPQLIVTFPTGVDDIISIGAPTDVGDVISISVPTAVGDVIIKGVSMILAITNVG